MTETTPARRIFAASGLLSWVFAAAVVAVLYQGWSRREDLIWTPESGAGYYLGILGGVMMLLLLLYPLSKRVKAMTRLLPVKRWFQIHMFFGVMGPVLVLLHSNFHLGSINGRVALFSMLTVATSGLIGRYVCQKIHQGLYGKKLKFNDLRADTGLLSEKLSSIYELAPASKGRLTYLESQISAIPSDALGSFVFWLKIRITALFLYRSVARDISAALVAEAIQNGLAKPCLRRQQRLFAQLLNAHKVALIHILEFHFWERLFSAWHLLHLPLFIMMIVTGVIHVYAVHVY